MQMLRTCFAIDYSIGDVNRIYHEAITEIAFHTETHTHTHTHTCFQPTQSIAETSLEMTGVCPHPLIGSL